MFLIAILTFFGVLTAPTANFSNVDGDDIISNADKRHIEVTAQPAPIVVPDPDGY